MNSGKDESNVNVLIGLLRDLANIGDFGCGEAKLAEAVKDRHTVLSFDHVAANDDVVACDVAHVWWSGSLDARNSAMSRLAVCRAGNKFNQPPEKKRTAIAETQRYS